ncbi:hypothetical protein Sjap_022864 [Stephania japonica]|uniref:Polyadenylate-binding protein n=1 Tax=Stephania japonica TaxID=461633 RepID=A0AAP0EV33_9MAGN
MAGQGEDQSRTSEAANNNAGASLSSPTALYVGDLELNVTDSQLYDLFSQLGQVVSVRVCRDVNTRRSLGYGYVNYSKPEDAARALDVLNFTLLNGKVIRIMYSHRDPSMRRSGAANIFIKNLDKAIDNKALHDTFSAFGNILSCKIATDASSQSKGYGFVQYDDEESAQIAIEKLNGMLLNDKPVFVGPFVRKQERENTPDKDKFNNVFVKNLSESTKEDDLKEAFGEYGNITSVVVMKDGEGKSKCFGFVNFENCDAAGASVEALNGKEFDGKEWYVGKAQKKSEREVELKERFQAMKNAVDKSQGVNLYVKNLDESIGDDILRELFSGYGTITSCKVMRDPSGVSRGSGFVAFSISHEASRALAEMNGKMVVNKPLYVAIAQKKEDRRAKLQAQFSQMRSVPVASSVAPRVPMYLPGGPGLGRSMFYGPQGPPAIISPEFVACIVVKTHVDVPCDDLGAGCMDACMLYEIIYWEFPGNGIAGISITPNRRLTASNGNKDKGCVTFAAAEYPGFGYQQQVVPGKRRGGTATPNFFRPMGQGQHPGGRLNGSGPVQQGQQPVSMMQQMLPSGDTFRVHARSPPYDMGMPFHDSSTSRPIPIGALASALANASPVQQRTMLGESLYPLVEKLEHEVAAKVTGMILEMDQTEVLHLLESPDALKLKVAEAMGILRDVAQQQLENIPSDQLAVLSLNDDATVS